MAGVLNYLSGWNYGPQWAGLLGDVTPQMMMDVPPGSGPSAAAPQFSEPPIPQAANPPSAAPQTISSAPDELAANADIAGNGQPPPLSAAPSGNWWKTDNPDGTSSLLGGMLSYDPAKDIGRNDRLGMIGAGLSDIAAQMSGHPEAATSLNQYARQNKLAAFQQQLGATGDDPVKMHSPQDNGYAIDPVSGKVTQFQQGQPTAPPGYSFAPDGSLVPLKGGQYDPNVIRQNAQIWRQAGTGNPMPGKVAAPGAINIHPAKLFGGP
jgi:hypothetical protein